MSFEDTVAARLIELTRRPDFATTKGLDAALRLLAKWRSQLVDSTLVRREGTTIKAGPFAGMAFVERASEANVSPKILGTYEAELHPVIETIIAANYERIVDIGCADGYYACGFAYRMPGARIDAFDINPEARRRCAALVERNGVAGRVEIFGAFDGEDFSRYAEHHTLVLMDAEGAEDDLVRPDLFPALRHLDVLVECHDVFRRGISQRMAERFEASHEVRRIEPALHTTTLPAWFSSASHLDQLLAIWEWRTGPTPWLFMQARSRLA